MLRSERWTDEPRLGHVMVRDQRGVAWRGTWLTASPPEARSLVDAGALLFLLLLSRI